MTEHTEIVPISWPLSESAYMRVTNRDLNALSVDALQAERTLLTIALAARVFGNRRDRVIVVNSGTSFVPLTETAWLRQRLAGIGAEQRAREHKRGRH